MACTKHLAALLIGLFHQQLIDLPLPQNFQMCIGLIKEQDLPGLEMQVCEQQQRLLHSQTCRGQRKNGARSRLLVLHLNRSRLANEYGLPQAHTKKLFD